MLRVIAKALLYVIAAIPVVGCATTGGKKAHAHTPRKVLRDGVGDITSNAHLRSEYLARGMRANFESALQNPSEFYSGSARPPASKGGAE